MGFYSGYIFSMILTILILAITKAQNSNELDLNDIQKQLDANGLDTSPLDGINTTHIGAAGEKVEQIFREKCEKQGAGYVVDSLKNQQDSLKECVTQQVNITDMKMEIDEAKKTGSMDEVFTKYCKKWPAMYSCIQNVTEQLRLCMTDEEKTAFNLSMDNVEKIKEFMCFKDGDRLAMFVGAGGIDCVTERQEEVTQCLNTTISSRVPNTQNISLTSLPSFLFSEQDCTDFETIRTCVNTELEKCEDSTPANIVDAFFKFIKKLMPCQKVDVVAVKTAASTQANNSDVLYNSSLVLVAIAMFLNGVRI